MSEYSQSNGALTGIEIMIAKHGSFLPIKLEYKRPQIFWISWLIRSIFMCLEISVRSTASLIGKLALMQILFDHYEIIYINMMMLEAASRRLFVEQYLKTFCVFDKE